MIRTATKRVLVALCSAELFSGVAFGQDNGATQAGPGAAVPADDEIIVLGKSPAEIRAQVRLAEQAVYDRWNAINSTDAYDIHCREEALTGSNVLRHVCQANFWRKAEAQSGTEVTRGLQGGASINPAELLAGALYRRRLMTEEMKQLARKDDELARDLWRLGNLEQALGATVRSQSRFATTSAEQTASEGTLPYDAALAADVRIGRKPWTHALTQRTFTFAHVNGEIRNVEVKCPGRTEELKYEAGAEWTLPGDWGACDLRVEAPRGTTFSLFEFE